MPLPFEEGSTAMRLPFEGSKGKVVYMPLPFEEGSTAMRLPFEGLHASSPLKGSKGMCLQSSKFQDY